MQHLGGLGVVGHPEVDPAHLQELVPHLEAGLVRQAVAGHGGHEHAAAGGRGCGGRAAGGLGAGAAALHLLDLDAELLAALLDVDGADLAGEGFVAVAGAGAGAEAGARGREVHVVGGGRQGRAPRAGGPVNGVVGGDLGYRTLGTNTADTGVRGYPVKCS